MECTEIFKTKFNFFSFESNKRKIDFGCELIFNYIDELNLVIIKWNYVTDNNYFNTTVSTYSNLRNNVENYILIKNIDSQEKAMLKLGDWKSMMEKKLRKLLLNDENFIKQYARLNNSNKGEVVSANN